jgi:glycosyltransferase involved in cell wall biosynthesis
MTHPIRVLHILGRLDRGGAETMIMNIYRNIDRNKIQFDFLIHTNDHCDYTNEIRKLGGEIYSIPRLTFENIIKYFSEINRFFREHKEYKIVHCHMLSASTICLGIAKIYGIDTRISHSHSSKSEKSIKGLVRQFLRIGLNNTANSYIACSKTCGVWQFGKRKVKTGTVQIINNAINASEFKFNSMIRDTVRKEININNKFVLGHIGRFVEVKNHEFLIDIFQEVKKINSNSELVLVGQGKLENSIKEKVKILGLEDSVKFLGVRSDINRLVQSMDVFLLPSHFEGLPVVGIEAQASGLKCFMSDVITREVNITGLVEFISLDKSPSYWAEKILECNTGYLRKDTILQINESGYNIAQVSRFMEEFYFKKQ